MEPTFQIVQALYNRAVSEEAGNDILAQDGVECKSEDILLRKVLETTKLVRLRIRKFRVKY